MRASSTRGASAALLESADTAAAGGAAACALVIGDNEPYGVRDETDYTIPEHGEKRGLPHVGIELRQDLITTEAGQAEWAERLTRALVSIARAAA